MIKVLNEMELESDFKKDNFLTLNDDNIYNNFSTSEMRELFCYLKTGYQNWYEFNNEKWGTKWNACETELKESFDKQFVDIEFDTAWCTPEPIFNEIATQNTDIILT